jgi:hypothetical protein
MLHDAHLNVEYMYAFVRSSGDNAVMIFRIEKEQEAIRLLESKGVNVIDGQRCIRFDRAVSLIPGGWCPPNPLASHGDRIKLLCFFCG